MMRVLADIEDARNEALRSVEAVQRPLEGPH
jgi:hypothetical protein